MRHTQLALIGLILAGSFHYRATAAETESRWWQFGNHDDVDVAQSPPGTAPTATTQQPATTPQQQQPDITPEQRWMIESPFTKISWPRIHMPALPKPHLPQMWVETQEKEATRNKWAEPNSEPAQPSSAQSLSDGARRAWAKTVDAFTPRGAQPAPDSPSSRVARNEIRPPFWKRMFAPKEETKEGSQTITEFMAQDRLDP